LLLELLVKANTGLEVQVGVLHLEAHQEAHQEVTMVVHLEDLAVLQVETLILQVALGEVLEEAHKVVLEEMVVVMVEVEVNQVPLRMLFQGYQVMTTQSLQKYPKHLSFVTVKLMEVIMQTQKQSAKHSTFVQVMEMVV